MEKAPDSTNLENTQKKGVMILPMCTLSLGLLMAVEHGQTFFLSLVSK